MVRGAIWKLPFSVIDKKEAFGAENEQHHLIVYGNSIR